jgi:hypothetical protein
MDGVDDPEERDPEVEDTDVGETETEDPPLELDPDAVAEAMAGLKRCVSVDHSLSHPRRMDRDELTDSFPGTLASIRIRA